MRRGTVSRGTAHRRPDMYIQYANNTPKATSRATADATKAAVTKTDFWKVESPKTAR